MKHGEIPLWTGYVQKGVLLPQPGDKLLVTNASLLVTSAALLRARTLLGAPGLTTRNKKLLGAKRTKKQIPEGPRDGSVTSQSTDCVDQGSGHRLRRPFWNGSFGDWQGLVGKRMATKLTPGPVLKILDERPKKQIPKPNGLA